MYRFITNQNKVKKPLLGNILQLDQAAGDSETTPELIEIVINKPYDSFSERDQEKLISAISQLMKINNNELKIVNKFKGSIKLHLLMTKMNASKLLELFKTDTLNH